MCIRDRLRLIEAYTATGLYVGSVVITQYSGQAKMCIRDRDETMLHRLINKVLIDKVKKVDGQNVQEIRIVYSPIK